LEKIFTRTFLAHFACATQLPNIVLLLGVVSIPLLHSGRFVPHQILESSGKLTGQLVAVTTVGREFSPELATVYLIYYKGRPGAANDTAGSAYEAEQLKVAQAIVKQTTENKERIAQEPKEQRVDEYQKYWLESVDQALKTAEAWAASHDEKWQFTSIKTTDGSWMQGDLQPGNYIIIARGHVGTLDAEWETRITLPPGKTLSVPMRKVKAGRSFQSK
jgi:hypothetical protein